MRWLVFIIITLATFLPAAAEDWHTADGKTYHDVVVIEQQQEGVRITYTGGVGIIPYYELSEDLQKRFGQDHDSLEIKRKAAEAAAEQKRLADEAAAALAKIQPGVSTQPDQAAQANTQGQPGQSPAANPSGQPGEMTVPGGVPNPNGNPAQAGGATPGTASNQPGGATPAGGSPNSGVAATSGQPGQAGGTNSPAGTANPSAAPGTALASGATNAAGVTNGATGQPPAGVGLTGSLADDYHPGNATPAEQVIQKKYPGSRFHYDSGDDVCYLDSPPSYVYLVLPEASPAAATPAGTFSLRVTTDGQIPETPDTVEGKFTPVTPPKTAADLANIKFLVDGTFIPITDLVTTDSDGTTPSVPSFIAFNLTLEQAHRIFKAKNVNFTVGSNNYRLDDNGLVALRSYFADVDQLPPASPSLARSYHKFVSRLPSIITMISTVCEYIILGSFAIVVMASIAAFVMGMTRFIKM
jgi:hypothetical protein